jgi:hypothetical protein
MLMTLKNLKIAQHQNTFCYATIHGGGYQPHIRRFEQGDYVYLQQTASTTLNVTIKHVILCVLKVVANYTR